MIHVIIPDNTRLAAGGYDLSFYAAGGIFLALARKGLDVRYVDQISNIEENSFAAPGQKSTDVCCYAVYFGNKTNAFRQMEDARRSSATPLIIAFGQFASAFPEEILLRGLADIVVTDDPEFVIPALLSKGVGPASWKNIPNLFYIREGGVIRSEKHLSHDLDDVPFISSYLYRLGYRPARMMTVRGCAYHCVHCDRSALWKGTVRQRSVTNVLREIEDLVETHHPPGIYFLDENFADDHKRLIEICDGMRRIKGEFYWSCTTRVDVVNREILLLMGRSRCRKISFGVESASPKVLRSIGKNYGPQDILNAVIWSKEAGLRVRVMVMTDIPGETDFDRNLTLSVLNKLGPKTTITTNRMVILPGSPFYYKGLREGWFTKSSFFEDEGVVFCDDPRKSVKL